METLHKRLRHQEERNLWTTLIMIDSQAVKNTCNAGEVFQRSITQVN
jgi:hypothetical protein